MTPLRVTDEEAEVTEVELPTKFTKLSPRCSNGEQSGPDSRCLPRSHVLNCHPERLLPGAQETTTFKSTVSMEAAGDQS